MKEKSKILNMEFDYDAKYIGERIDEGWKHDAWKIHINGIELDYKTGTGHRKTIRGRGMKEIPTKPGLDDVLYSLVMDAQAGSELFVDFCTNCGHDTDSRKSLEIYQACQDSALHMRKLGINLETAVEAFQDF